jgi:hypothetical protein
MTSASKRTSDSKVQTCAVQQSEPAGPKAPSCGTSAVKCHATFKQDELSVVVEQTADAVDKERYNSAHQQCLLHMVSYPPTSFTCVTSGDMSAPRTEVKLQRSVLQQLPLLQDISKSTSDKEDGRNTELELPCSIWGFVSLLMLLEGSLQLEYWFGQDMDPSLPSQTLLVR